VIVSASEIWFWKSRVGSTSNFTSLNRLEGHAFDENNAQPERFREYEIQFILDGFKYTIIGTNLELLKTSIIANFFPGHSYEDMFLISSTVKK
jgi:hypothetical protein